jgi:glycine hydroxymethyltransferase
MVASGIRLGTPALTTRGMTERDMAQVARLVSRALHAVDDETELAEVKREVRKICDRFPLYASRLASYEKALARA